MTLRINDIAPNFTASSTQGEINFHDWIGDGWAVLFSHPKHKTPVCSTELGEVEKLSDEFKKRNVKTIMVFNNFIVLSLYSSHPITRFRCGLFE